MTVDEFRQLTVGTTIRHYYTEATIKWIEFEYVDGKRVPWAVHLDNGTNLRVSDGWLDEVRIVK